VGYSSAFEGGALSGGIYIIEAPFDVLEEGGDLETRALKGPDCVH